MFPSQSPRVRSFSAPLRLLNAAASFAALNRARVRSLSPRALAGFLLVFASLVVARGNAQGLTTFATPTAIGSTAAPQTVTVTFSQGGVLGSVSVLTQGTAGLDFNKASTTCAAGATYTAGQTCSVNVTFSPVYAGQRLGAVVLRDATGVTLGTSYLAGTGVGAMAVFIPGIMTTVVGNAAWIYNGDNANANATSIYLPYGFAIDGAGDIAVADKGNLRIRLVSGSTNIVTTIAGNGLVGSTGDGGPAVDATVSNPGGVAFDAAGNIYFADTGNNVIRKIDAVTKIITTVAGMMGHHGYTGDNGLATQATLNTPNGIAFDAAGNLYIVDTANNAVRKVSASTGTITTLAGIGTPGYSGDGALANAAALCNPWGVSIAPSGVVIIADQGNSVIRQVSTSGIITTIAGNNVKGYSGDQGPATQAQLNTPAGIVVDVAGNLYIADSGNNVIRKVNATTGVITTVAGGGASGGNGDGASALLAGMYGPYSLSLDNTGSLLIADVFDNRIRRVSSNNTMLEYPAIRVGRVSSGQTATIENDGNAPLTIGTVSVVSNSQVDVPLTTCVSSSPVSALNSCLMGADFAPTTTGNPIFGSLSIASNASNAPSILQTEGQVLDIDPSTITLSSSANPGNFGAAITFSVNVSSAGSTPTGTVTLLDGTTVLGTASLGAGGNAALAISTLTVGTHTITASYGGDSSNASSVSSPISQVIRDAVAPTTTSLIASAIPAQAGATLQLTATLSIPAIDQGNGTPTGIVTFKDGSTVIGTATLASGVASLSIQTLSVGSHSITAVYPGATAYAPSTSSVVIVVIQLATSSATLSTSANPVLGGAPLTLTATLSSTGGLPTGSVTFYDGSTLLGSSTLNAQGLATFGLTGSTLAVGSHSFTVRYAGDSNNGSSVSAPIAEVVNTATSSTALISSANPAFQGAIVQLSATVTSNGGTPTGQVQFLDGATSLGSTSLNASGVATISTANLTQGTHNLTAIYAGDSLDAGSTSAALPQVIQAASASVTLGSSSNPAVFNTGLTFTATVQGTGSQPTGTVVLLDGTTSLATLTLNGSGTATFTTSSLALGAHTIVAQYSGDANHSATNSAALAQGIQQSTSTALTSSTLNSIAGTQIQWHASVSGAAGQTPAGTVNFTDGGNLLAQAALDQTGAATYTSAALAVGNHTIAASYQGNTLSQGSSSSPIVEQVKIATTVTTLVSSSNPAFSGTSVTFSAAVAGNGGTPTGTMTFTDGTAVLAVVNLNASATATYTTSSLSAGNHEIIASYSGDADDSPSSSASVTQQILQKTTVAIASSANPSLVLNNVTISVTVSNGGQVLPTGTVTLTDGSTTLGTANLASGLANFTLASPSVGTHTLTATYAGDIQNLPASSPALAQVVTLRPSTDSLTTTGNNLSFGQTVTFLTVIQGSGPTAPSGTITFTSGTLQLGTATLVNGVASLTITPQQGTYTVIASYPGDNLYAASTSAGASLIVGPTNEFAFSMTPASLSVPTGSHGTLQIDITTANTFADTIALGCAGLPQYATCTFSKNQIAVANGQTASLTVTVDTGDPLGSGANVASLTTSNHSGIVACMLPAGALLGFLLFGFRKSTRRLSGLLMLLILGAVSVAGLSGCSSSFQGQTTAAGTYSFRIIGTGNTSGASSSGNVALTVTK